MITVILYINIEICIHTPDFKYKYFPAFANDYASKEADWVSEMLKQFQHPQTVTPTTINNQTNRRLP